MSVVRNRVTQMIKDFGARLAVLRAEPAHHDLGLDGLVKLALQQAGWRGSNQSPAWMAIYAGASKATGQTITFDSWQELDRTADPATVGMVLVQIIKTTVGMLPEDVDLVGVGL